MGRRVRAAIDETPKPSGSISGKLFSEEALAGLREGGVYDLVAAKLTDGRPIPLPGGSVVTTTDVAIALMIGGIWMG